MKVSGLGVNVAEVSPEMGCCWKKQAKQVYVRVMGLPLHLWSREMFKKIGDGCGGFVAVDEDTASFRHLQWASVLVQLIGREKPRTLQVVEGIAVYVVQLWWEILPWISNVEPMCYCTESVAGERGEGSSCADEGVGKRRLWKEKGVLDVSTSDCLGGKDGMVSEKGFVEEAGGIVDLEERMTKGCGGLDLTKGSFVPMSKLFPETPPSGSIGEGSLNLPNEPLVLAGGLVGEGSLNLGHRPSKLKLLKLGK